MKARRDIEKRIEKEKQAITELRSQIQHKDGVIQGLQEALKLLPKDENGRSIGSRHILRPGSDMDKIRILIEQTGKPMHISDILTRLGKQDSKRNRLSVSSSLSRYVRAGEIFKRVGPNIFALIDMENLPEVELPADFGVEEVSSSRK